MSRSRKFAPIVARGRFIAGLVSAAALSLIAASLVRRTAISSVLIAFGIACLTLTMVGWFIRSKRVEDQTQKRLRELVNQTKNTPDIAGSVSKGRARQESSAGLLESILSQNSQLKDQVGRIEKALLEGATKNPEKETQAQTLLAQRLRDVEKREWELERREAIQSEIRRDEIDFQNDPTSAKKWELDHELILPGSISRSAYSQLRTDKRIRFLKHLKVAAILDEFSFLAIEPEVDLHTVRPSDWQQVFELVKPDVFVCESAWRGYPTAENAWKGRIYASSNFSYENRADLKKIIKYCNAHSIPTVFWNKEDPTHFGDDVNNFVSTARLFDFIFTTAAECVPDYESMVGRSRVGLFPFAVQPRLFNPGVGRDENNQVVFAGSWYKAHPERAVAQKALFEAVEAAGLELTIFDRHSNGDTKYFGYPEIYAGKVRPAVSYLHTANLYRDFSFGISVNTATSSPTMLARRAFEMAAAGCTVITNRTEATDHFFGDRIIALQNGETIAREDLTRVREARVELINDVLINHSYENRLIDVFARIGLDVEGHSQRATLLVPVEDVSDIPVVIQMLDSNKGVLDDLVLLVSSTVPNHRVQEFYNLAIGRRVRVVSEKLWKEGAIKTKTVFSRPFVYVTLPGKTADASAIRRGLAHAVYSREPVRPSVEPQNPHHGFARLTDGVIVRATEFEFYMRRSFEPETVLDV